MTSLFDSLEDSSYSATYKDANHNIHHRHSRNILKSKKNTYELKCKQILKKKLKKYKLRQDGKEDQDIIDVSNTLVSSLLIRSPNQKIDYFEQDLDEFRPKNYLFRMVRRKQTKILTKTTTGDFDIKCNGNNDIKPECVNGEEKKQTNAFKLLMDSRNKSLGANTPGKEMPIDPIESQEVLEKKHIKAKRNLLLQKMAESKGSVKKKEIEDQQEKYIKKKMDKRAERLKSMIVNIEPKTSKDDQDKKPLTIEKPRSPLDSIVTEKNKKVIDKPIKTLQLVSIFTETIDNISPEKKHVLKEDSDFLKKLSPSLRKKESMLSYFKKVEKDSDSTLVDSENDNVIKVKLGLKHKKRGRKKKLSLKRKEEDSHEENDEQVEEVVVVDEIVHKEEITINENTTIISTERRKRKREIKDSIPNNENVLDESSAIDGRPKRMSKKPVKYNEEFYLSSTDEELHIFTPKKKKHIKSNSTPKPTPDQKVRKDKEKLTSNKSVTDSPIMTKEKKILKVSTPVKPTKLAPIFASKPNPAATEAKQKFLQSGVPEKLKKIITKEKENSNQDNEFIKVVHIQQLDKALLEHPPLCIDEEDNSFEILPICEDNLFTPMLNMSTSQNAPLNLQSNMTIDVHTTLQHFKEVYHRFPVNRTYKLLRGKKKGEFRESSIYSNMDNSVEILNCSIDLQNDNPDQITWCDKYKHLTGNEIIGNFDTIRELKKWLVTWTENSKKNKGTNESDSSDYYESDPDSRDSMKSNDNLLILSGPVGSGKTSSVYAVAAELCIKVIEVNVSSKRTGKIMLQDLQEATQSHTVNRGTGSAENSQKSEEVIDCDAVIVKKRGRPKKILEQPTPNRKEKTLKVNGQTSSQDSTRKGMSLILIDDADIVFDQDDGFCSAIMQLVQSSKRPVILITGSLACPHLQRFVQCSKIMKMHPLLPNMLGTWLDIMCLADSGSCWPGLGAKILNVYKGDMRKTINCLQFYVCSQEQVDGNSQTESQNSDTKVQADDENSSMSWADNHEEKNCISQSSALSSYWSWNSHMDEQNRHSNEIFNIWWSIPKTLYTSGPSLSQEKQKNNVDTTDKSETLESICNVLDSISVSDYFSQIRPDIQSNITSDPWYSSECDSASELENLDGYNNNLEINSELCYEMVKGCLCTEQEKLRISKIDVDFPDMAVKRLRDRTVSRNNNLTTSLCPQSLDRKALALDYWSFCRNICRIEKSKTDTNNSRRNNRHCHYLKSLSALCKSDSFESLANSLNST